MGAEPRTRASGKTADASFHPDGTRLYQVPLLITRRGFPCCVRFPCVHAAATTPMQRMGVLLAQNHPSVSAFPDSTFGSACTSTFSRFAQRSLALRPAHSRGHPNS